MNKAYYIICNIANITYVIREYYINIVCNLYVITYELHINYISVICGSICHVRIRSSTCVPSTVHPCCISAMPTSRSCRNTIDDVEIAGMIVMGGVCPHRPNTAGGHHVGSSGAAWGMSICIRCPWGWGRMGSSGGERDATATLADRYIMAGERTGTPHASRGRTMPGGMSRGCPHACEWMSAWHMSDGRISDWCGLGPWGPCTWVRCDPIGWDRSSEPGWELSGGGRTGGG